MDKSQQINRKIDQELMNMREKEMLMNSQRDLMQVTIDKLEYEVKQL